MNCRPYRLALFALCTVALMPATAQAQWYGAQSARPAPLYPHQLQPGQAYTVEAAPGTYVMQRPGDDFPYVDCRHGCGRYEPRRHVARYPRRRIVIQTRKVVHDAPLVIEHRRVVDDPPRVIVRRHYVDDARPSQVVISGDSGDHLRGGKRVIHAEAEITILGPDRMNIRLYRRRSDAGTRAFDQR